MPKKRKQPRTYVQATTVTVFDADTGEVTERINPLSPVELRRATHEGKTPNQLRHQRIKDAKRTGVTYGSRGAARTEKIASGRRGLDLVDCPRCGTPKPIRDYPIAMTGGFAVNRGCSDCRS